MPQFLLELFSEEIPARMQERAFADLCANLHGALLKAGYDIDGRVVDGFVTPRRLAVIVDELPEVQADVTTERKGPKTK